MIFGLRASRKRLTESTRRSAAAQVSDAVAEVSRSLVTLITEAENRVGCHPSVNLVVLDILGPCMNLEKFRDISGWRDN